MYRYKLKSINDLSRDTISLELEPISVSDNFKFFPGQYVALGFKKFGRPSPMRCFSITNSPNESILKIALKKHGSYTKTISKLAIGDSLFVHGPFGNFVIDEDSDKNIVLIAGGIGITPYISMLRYLTEENIKLPTTLVYAVRSSDNIPFYDEIIKLEKSNPYLRVIFLVSQQISSSHAVSRKILKSRLTSELMGKITNGKYDEFTYFICGSKTLTHSATDILVSNGVIHDKIITEEFSPNSQLKNDSADEKRSIPIYTYLFSGGILTLGILFFMAIDLIRAVPKLVNAQTTQNPAPVNTDDTKTPTTTINQSTPAQSTPTYNPPTPAPSQNTYQQPTTSVS